MSNEKDWIAVKALTRGWLLGNSVALTGVAGEVSRSTINRFKLALQKRIVDYVSTIRQEERRAAIRDAIQIVDTAPLCFCAGKQYIDPVALIQRMNWALEAAANENREGRDDG